MKIVFNQFTLEIIINHRFSIIELVHRGAAKFKLKHAFLDEFSNYKSWIINILGFISLNSDQYDSTQRSTHFSRSGIICLQVVSMSACHFIIDIQYGMNKITINSAILLPSIENYRKDLVLLYLACDDLS